MKLIKATGDDAPSISRIHAASWKSAYKGMVPQVYLDNLQMDFWVPAFESWINNHTLTVQLVLDNNDSCRMCCLWKIKRCQSDGLG